MKTISAWVSDEEYDSLRGLAKHQKRPTAQVAGSLIATAMQGYDWGGEDCPCGLCGNQGVLAKATRPRQPPEPVWWD